MNPSFLFLPDISGFTHFVNQTEVEHSSHIIRELLELLIDNQTLGLELAEIEGDALFYYAHERLPSPSELFAQVEHMFAAFHRHLIKYDLQRICNCGACSTAVDLSLKFIAHAGPLEFIQIKNQRKPFGKTVISAHRLMKNEVPSDEYLLLSEDLLRYWAEGTIDPPGAWELARGASTYDLGKISYDYYHLHSIKDGIKPDLIHADYYRDPQPFRSQVLVETTTRELFELVSNLKYRTQWQTDISRVEYERKRVNRSGEEHLCVIQGYDLILETMATNNREEPFEYVEKLKTFPLPIIQEMTNYFCIEPQATKHSLVTLEIHVKVPRWLRWLVWPTMRKAAERKMHTTLLQLKALAEEKTR
ncbi:MAG: DUF2652 domain-containing protein [Bacteroidota bacterium]